MKNPCFPSPCGPNAECRNIGNTPSCSCHINFIGSPPNCRPECSIHADCASDRACINSKCQDPCPGSCGISAVCNVLNHIPICTCVEGYIGDPFTNCRQQPLEGKYIYLFKYNIFIILLSNTIIAANVLVEPVVTDACSNVRCGSNAECINGQCQCLPEYHGDPYFNCRPECVFSTDCDIKKACVQQKCVDPCIGTCGVNAICQVVNHIPMCTCNNGFTGNAFVVCNPIRGNFDLFNSFVFYFKLFKTKQFFLHSINVSYSYF